MKFKVGDKVKILSSATGVGVDNWEWITGMSVKRGLLFQHEEVVFWST